MSTDVLVVQEQSFLPPETDDEMLIAIWLNSKRSACTKDAYQRDIQQFLAFVCKPLKLLTLLDVQAYQASLVGKQATITRKMSVVKSLLSFGSKMQYLRYNVGAAITLESTNTGLAQRILSEEQIIRMISLENNTRNHCILHLLYHAGLRVSELVSLDWSMVTERQDGQGQISIVGKGNKERQVLLQAAMYKELLSLKNGHAEIFTSRNGGKLQARQIEKIVKAAAQRAGIDVNVSPHWFRHAHASHSLDRGAPISLVSATLGHSSIAVTGRYIHARPNSSSGQYLAM